MRRCVEKNTRKGHKNRGRKGGEWKVVHEEGVRKRGTWGGVQKKQQANNMGGARVVSGKGGMRKVSGKRHVKRGARGGGKQGQRAVCNASFPLLLEKQTKAHRLPRPPTAPSRRRASGSERLQSAQVAPLQTSLLKSGSAPPPGGGDKVGGEEGRVSAAKTRPPVDGDHKVGGGR